MLSEDKLYLSEITVGHDLKVRDIFYVLYRYLIDLILVENRSVRGRPVCPR